MKTTTHLTAGPAASAAASRVRGGSVCLMPWYGDVKRFMGFVSADHITRTRRPEEVPR